MSWLLTYKLIITTGWFLTIFITERLSMAVPWPETCKKMAAFYRVISNMSLATINIVLSPLIIIPVTAYVSQHSIDWRPVWMQSSAWILLDIVILDAFLYGWHRMVHQLPLLWRFHRVHHLDQFLDSTSALRFHFGEVMLAAIVRSLIVVALAIPITSVIIFEIIVIVATIFHHSNLRIPATIESALSKVMVTPSIHWIHHRAERKDTDSNYATVFSFWDGLFNTRSPTKRTPTLMIGVEGETEKNLSQLLILPFRR